MSLLLIIIVLLYSIPDTNDCGVRLILKKNYVYIILYRYMCSKIVPIHNDNTRTRRTCPRSINTIRVPTRHVIIYFI